MKHTLRRPMFWYLLLIIFLLGMVGSMDFEDALNQRDIYCQRVSQGVWPDYQETYASECAPLGYPKLAD